jgi:hypothetical protein
MNSLTILQVILFRKLVPAFRKPPDSRQKSRFFLIFYLLMEGSGSRSVQIITDPDPVGLKTDGSYGSGTMPADKEKPIAA